MTNSLLENCEEIVEYRGSNIILQLVYRRIATVSLVHSVVKTSLCLPFASAVLTFRFSSLFFHASLRFPRRASLSSAVSSSKRCRLRSLLFARRSAFLSFIKLFIEQIALKAVKVFCKRTKYCSAKSKLFS